MGSGVGNVAKTSCFLTAKGYTMNDLLKAAIAATGTPQIISEQHDPSKIDTSTVAFDRGEAGWARGMTQGQGMTAMAQRRADLNVANGRVSVMVAGEAPWHKLGVNVAEAVTSQQALELANLANWDLQKVETYIDFQDKRVSAGAFAVVRGDNGVVLTKGRAVGKGYEISTNEECFGFVDDVISSGAMFETAGAIRDGQKVWMLAKMPGELSLADGNDEIYNYMLFTTTHDGTGSIHFYPTNERAVCKNTLRMASVGRHGEHAMKFRHTSNISKNADRAKALLRTSSDLFAEFSEKATFLASQPIQADKYFGLCLDNILDITIAEQPLTQAGIDDGSVLKAIVDIADTEKKETEGKRYERATKRRTALLDNILERHESERCEGIAGIAGTAWSAYNAVSEYADHGMRYNGEGVKTQEAQFESNVNGRADVVKQTAFQLAIEQAT